MIRRAMVWRALVLLPVAVLYLPVARGLAHVWATDPYAGHGPFVPAFAAIMLWADRDRLRAAASGGGPLGLLLIAAGLALLGAGMRLESLVTQTISLVVVVAGAVVWLIGRRALRVALVPVVFLAFMVPLPREVVALVTLQIQAFVAWFAAVVLDALGIPVFHAGVLLHLPQITLEVAEVCNGLRFLTALVVMTLAFAYISQPTLLRKVALVLAAVPTAVVANAVRVAGIGVAAYYVGPQAASGFIHDYIGKTVWAATAGILIGLGLLLRRVGLSSAGRGRVAVSGDLAPGS
jgi:exosortase